MKKPVINKKVPVRMLYDDGTGIKKVWGTVIITNDRFGKTLSIICGGNQLTMAFEQIEKYLK